MESVFGKESMTLRIERSVKGEVVAFTLSGRIRAEGVAELQKLFEVEGQERHIALDLKEVKLVDRETVGFLARLEANGARLDNCPPYIREWIVRESPGR